MPARVASSSSGPSSPLPTDDSPAPRRQSLPIRDQSGSKRKRANTQNDRASSRRRTSAPASSSDEGEEEEVARPGRPPLPEEYDPDQPMEERRRLQREFRELHKTLADNMEEYMQPTSKGLQDTLMRAQELSKDVKQTNEATIDSRLLVTTIDLSYRKTLRIVQGNTSQGVDVDEFVSKCITYMRRGQGIDDDEAPDLSSTQRHRRRTTDGRRNGGGGGGNDEEDDNDEMLDWAHLGRFAALPSIHRPALPGFLVGPLSVEKKIRKMTRRTAPFRKDDLEETRPEVLDVEDLAKKENDLTAICAKILKQLKDVQSRAQEELEAIFANEPDMDAAEQVRVMHEHGLRDTGGVCLMRFVMNPRSFGQTVENMFYVSFLIRDGKIAVELDDMELPAISPVYEESSSTSPSRQANAAKHQAIFSMDMATWTEIIEAFSIERPMIEHRKEPSQQGPGERGWYN